MQVANSANGGGQTVLTSEVARAEDTDTARSSAAHIESVPVGVGRDRGGVATAFGCGNRDPPKSLWIAHLDVIALGNRAALRRPLCGLHEKCSRARHAGPAASGPRRMG